MPGCGPPGPWVVPSGMTVLADNLAAIAATSPEAARSLEMAQPPLEHSDVVISPYSAPWRRLDTWEDYALLTQAGVPINPPRDPRWYADSMRGRQSNYLNMGVIAQDALMYGDLFQVRGSSIDHCPPGWIQPLYIIEERTALLRALLEHVDMTWAFTDGTFLFVGQSAQQEFVEWMLDDYDRPLPHIGTPSVDTGLASRLQDVASERQDGVAERVAFNEGVTTPTEIRKVLLITSLHTNVVQHVTDQLARGFDQLGVQTRVIREFEHWHTLSGHTMATAVSDFRPDMVVAIDLNRVSSVPSQLPWVNWFQDDLPRMWNGLDKLGELDFGFGVTLGFVERMREGGYPHAEFMAFGVDWDLFHKDITDDYERSIATITHVDPVPEPTDAPGFFDMIEAAQRLGGIELTRLTDIDPIIELGVKENGWTISDMDQLRRFGNLQGRRLGRINQVRVLVEAGIPVKLYGNGWDQTEYAEHAMWPIEDRQALRNVYNHHAAVVHANSGCELHPRLLECHVAGGLCITRIADLDQAHPENLTTVFKPNVDLMTYITDQELVDQCRLALDNHITRRLFISSARDRIKETCTYKQRAQQILDTVTPALAARLA